MKKIFTLFAALAMVMSMSAATKTVYFKTQQWWHKDGAASAAYYWGTGGNANDWPGTRMTKVVGETNMWSIEIDTDKYQNVIFTRVNGSGTVQDWGAKTKDLEIPTDGANLFTLGATEAWDGNQADGTWSTYTPSTKPIDYYITGTLAGGWNANEVKMTYGETSKTYSHTFTAVAADEEYKFKVTDGTWDNHWGADAVSQAIDGVGRDGDGNVVFTLSTGGDVTITFDGIHIQLTTTGSFAPIETYDYYVVGSFNGWNTADVAYGMIKDGDVYKKEVTFAAAAEFKICNGTWDAAWGAQNLGGKKYAELEGEDNIKLKEEKTFTIIFNPTQHLITFEGLTSEEVNVTYVLMGVGGDWKVGVPMIKNEKAEGEEYMLIGQTITASDSVKVVKLVNGEAKHYCGNVKDDCKELVLENKVNDNIVLAPGVYDFYYDVAADAIWIVVSSSDPSAVGNVIVEKKAVKVIRNGQMYILRDGVMYNAIGQIAE